jgi:aldose 1-epimerase
MKIEIEKTKNGWQHYKITNGNGMRVSLLNFGGIITEILVPDRSGVFENVVLGYKNLSDYEQNPNYFGAITGRVAGRIQDASFTLDDDTYSLESNEGSHHLHGGPSGFHQVVWEASTFQTADRVGVKLMHASEDGDGGYPGNLNTTVTYTLTNHNELILDYSATTDKTTALTITNHSYFNLSGNLAETIQNHIVTMDSDEFVELDKELIPTGKKIDVTDTPFDFRLDRKIADGIQSTYEQNLVAKNGYDHYFLFNQTNDEQISVREETSGRMMNVKTNQPGVVMYTSTNLEEGFQLAERNSEKYLGVCFETQSSPASLHHEGFPTVILKADETYEKQTVFTFITD